jgi:uncharacterized membrane protein
MKSRIMKPIGWMLVLAGMASPVQLAAQQHPRFKLIDLGTLGGPHSYGSVNGDGFQLLNNSGVVASYADLAAPDPNAGFFCYALDCFQIHAFRWKDGVMTDLGALPVNNDSAAGSINARGWITGQSQSAIIDPVLGIPEFRAVLWKQNHITDLGTLGGTESLGIYVNDSGQVIGFSTINSKPRSSRIPRRADPHFHLGKRGDARHRNARRPGRFPRYQLQWPTPQCGGRNVVPQFNPEPCY